MAQQCLNAGLCDELQIGIMPVLLGDGLRMFENIDVSKVKLKRAGFSSLDREQIFGFEW
ncbi:MAG: dihydrofolate reductase family protein [Anaerolineae bacterium]|nr:dihydrofolate reductase family protein [Anaerolineae bacterium]